MKASLTILSLLFSCIVFGQTERSTDVLKAKLNNETNRSLIVVPKDTARVVRIGPCTSRIDAAHQPLIVVDGVVKESSLLSAVNPNDIQSIQVLKNQKAIEKFGERAKYGVILITMKCKEQTTPSL